jgi:hypothetical protein
LDTSASAQKAGLEAGYVFRVALTRRLSDWMPALSIKGPVMGHPAKGESELGVEPTCPGTIARR